MKGCLEVKQRAAFFLPSSLSRMSTPPLERNGILTIAIELVSKPQIRPKGNSSADSKAPHTRQYVSISDRLATPPLGLRWGF